MPRFKVDQTHVHMIGKDGKGVIVTLEEFHELNKQKPADVPKKVDEPKKVEEPKKAATKQGDRPVGGGMYEKAGTGTASLATPAYKTNSTAMLKPLGQPTVQVESPVAKVAAPPKFTAPTMPVSKSLAMPALKPAMPMATRSFAAAPQIAITTRTGPIAISLH
jgi:hypothetical protein